MNTLTKQKLDTTCKDDIAKVIRGLKNEYSAKGIKTTSAYTISKNHSSVYIYEVPVTEPAVRVPYKTRKDKGSTRGQYAKREPEAKPRKPYAQREPETTPRKKYKTRKKETKPRKGVKPSGRKARYLVTQKINLEEMVDIINSGDVKISRDGLIRQFKLHAMAKKGICPSLYDSVKLDIDSVELCTPIFNNKELREASEKLGDAQYTVDEQA